MAELQKVQEVEIVFSYSSVIFKYTEKKLILSSNLRFTITTICSGRPNLPS